MTGNKRSRRRSLVAGVPALVALHIAAAWTVLALMPFTRLAHIFALPLGYLWRAPQKVVWGTVPLMRLHAIDKLMAVREGANSKVDV